MAVLSRTKYVISTERSVGLMASDPTVPANVEAKSSFENVREVLDVAILDA